MKTKATWHARPSSTRWCDRWSFAGLDHGVIE
jgi:hypothetical protein